MRGVAGNRPFYAFYASLSTIALLWSAPGLAQEPTADVAGDGGRFEADTPVADEGNEITVTGWRLRQLDRESETASRLGLSIRETPATVDQITANEILTRGFRTVEEATVSLPGVTSGGSPGAPSLFSMRGFTGGQVTVLHNGLYLGPAQTINRPGNTFNIESIDILKGPASVLFGQGAVGGAVNIVNKSPDFKEDSLQVLGSFATFDTVSVGVGGNKLLSDNLAARLDVSYHRTGGFVEDAPADSFNATAALLFEPSADFSIEVGMDFLEDNLSPYFGTPLVPASFATDPIDGILTTANDYVIDRRTRFKNYNVEDSRAHSRHYWPRVVINWAPSDSVSISNTAYYFHATRQWLNAENFIFNETTNLIDRDRFFVLHNQNLAGNQFSVTFKHKLFGLDNRLVAGIDYSHLDFKRERGFPDGDSVDPLNPSRGLFGPLVGRVSPTRWDQAALFAEDALDVADGFKLVTGIRAERLYLTRENFDFAGNFEADTSFTRTYKLLNWRFGAVYDVAPNVTTYASFSTGKDPVGSDIFLVDANEDFGLSSSRQFEIGLKADALGGRASFTLSAYSIKRKNILTQVALDQLSNIGSQESKGVEFTSEMKVTDNWTLIASGSYVDAKFGEFVDPFFGIAASGNRPPNVPKWVGSIWTTVRDIGGLSLEVGGGMKYVASSYGNTANTLKLNSYATGIVYASYELTPSISLTGRINNVFDKTYVQWADIYYPAQVLMGEPRRFEVSILGRF